MAGIREDDNRINVQVVEEHEILRRGLIASLQEDQRLLVRSTPDGDLSVAGVDVAVVSTRAAVRDTFPCPIVVCSDSPHGADAAASINTVAGVLQRRTLTAAQLQATVHAAAAGLRVHVNGAARARATNGAPTLDRRARLILELLAGGMSTREIAERMNYSERTIKKLITGLEHQLEARTRAQLVAEGIRGGLI